MSLCSNAVERTVLSGSGGSIGNQLFHSDWTAATPQIHFLHWKCAHTQIHGHTHTQTMYLDSFDPGFETAGQTYLNDITYLST